LLKWGAHTINAQQKGDWVMLKGISINETVDFVSSLDKEDPKTVFVIKNITHEDKLRIFSGAMKPDGTLDMTVAGDKAFDIITAGVKAIRNLDNQDYTEITKEVLNRIPFVIITEILGKILEFNQLGEIEAKN